jgi:hypothetical protein
MPGRWPLDSGTGATEYGCSTGEIPLPGGASTRISCGVVDEAPAPVECHGTSSYMARAIVTVTAFPRVDSPLKPPAVPVRCEEALPFRAPEASATHRFSSDPAKARLLGDCAEVERGVLDRPAEGEVSGQNSPGFHQRAQERKGVPFRLDELLCERRRMGEGKVWHYIGGTTSDIRKDTSVDRKSTT